jgi:flagellar hook-associated protein 1 FlgK
MGSTFGGIVQAGTGLTAASYGLQVVSQNIDNADTPGYTRQASQQQAADGVGGVPTLYVAPTGLGGVTVASTSRLNDPVLDARSRTEHGRSGAADTTASVTSQVEDVFPEPSNTGLTEQLNDYWNAWAAVSNAPTSDAARSVLIGSAATVASTLNSMSSSLTDISQSTDQSLSNTVTDVNAEAAQLYTVNKQIAVGVGSGQDVNALLDTRDQLLDKMASQVDAKPTFNQDGTVSVSVAGEPLVQWTYHVGGGANQLSLSGSGSSTAITVTAGVPSANPPIPATSTAPSGSNITFTGGSASAYMTALTSTTSGIPYYQSLLDGVANSLISATTAAQAAGYPVPSSSTTSPAPHGQPMFSGTGASSIAVTSGFQTSDVAASTTDGISPNGYYGSNALTSSSLATASGSADKLYQGLVGSIGQASKLATQASTTQTSVTTSVDNLRTAASGVSTDEEIGNLLTYQRAYQASSRVISTLDDMLDTLINKMGV